MDTDIIVKLVISVVSIAYAGVCTLVSVIKSVKARDKQILIEELTAEIIPLMEQAEQAFDTGEERELWVVKKLGEKLHIDFYKYKKILKIVLEIIKKICEDTKINVNKVRVQNVLPEVKSGEDKDNGVF